MKKFIVLYTTPIDQHGAMAALTAEQKAEMMKPWFAWKEKYGERIVDMGAPLQTGSSTGDGDSWSSSTEETSGFSIVSAEDLADAKSMFAGHPIIQHGNNKIEICEFAPM